MSTPARLAGLLALACLLAACAEKPQTQTRKTDTKAWEAQGSGFAAPGYAAGDQAAWESQMRKRSQGQNEYSRTAANP